MDALNAITADIPLESFRAVIAAGLFAFVFTTGRRTLQHRLKGWNQVVCGFALLLFASVWDVTDNFDALNRFVVIGDTHWQAFLEKVVGYLGGFVLLFVGFLRWLPLAIEGAKSQERLELEEMQKRYRDLVDLSPDAIILHHRGRLVYANAAAAALVGAPSPEALLNMSIMDFIHPAYHEQTRERLRVLGEGGLEKLPLIELKILGGGGKEFVVEVASGNTNFMGRTVMQSVLRDISDRMRTEAALKESERELRAIFDNMAEFYYRTGLDGEIVRASGAALDVTGWDSAEIIGRKLSDHYVDPQGREQFLAALRDAGGVLRNYEAEMKRRDGEPIWVSTNARYFHDADGNVAGVEGTVRDITEAVRARNVLQHMAMHDGLTGLGNRRSFEMQLMGALPRARRGETGGAVLYFDLDGFKSVNDTFGHDLGDSVLRQVGKRLKSFIRETDFVARIGGDEFCLIMEGAAGREAIAKVAEKLIATLTEPCEADGHTVTLGVSVGIAPFDGDEAGGRDDDYVHVLISHADQAMYEAKKAGGNGYRFFDALKKQATA